MSQQPRTINLGYSRLRMFASVRNTLLLCCSYVYFLGWQCKGPFDFLLFACLAQLYNAQCCVGYTLSTCRLIYLIYLMNFSNRIEIWPSAGYLFCFLPDIYLCHQSKHLHFTTMTIYLFLFEGVQFDTVEIYIKTWLNIESIVNTVKA